MTSWRKGNQRRRNKRERAEWRAAAGIVREAIFAGLERSLRLSYPEMRVQVIRPMRSGMLLAYRAMQQQAGTCRHCGCTETRACSVEIPGHGMGSERPCGWVPGSGRTVCDAPACVEQEENW